MYKERKELYFADDGTPFEENRLACEAYDYVYHKIYSLIEYGKVLFWNYKCELVNKNLLDHKWNTEDKLCYYDWLKKQLEHVAYFTILIGTDTSEFEEAWGLVTGLLCLGSSKVDKLYAKYRPGDLCMFDTQSCRYINQDDIVRETQALKEQLANTLQEELKCFRRINFNACT